MNKPFLQGAALVATLLLLAPPRGSAEGREGAGTGPSTPHPEFRAGSTTPALTPAADLTGKSVTEPAAKAPKKAEESGGATEITAEEATFNQKTHLGIFTKNVVVVNPQFKIECNKLIAHLRHAADAPPVTASAPGVSVTPLKGTPAPAAHAGSPAPAATPKPTGSKEASSEGKAGGLEKAEAEGEVVIIQDKTEADGTITHGEGHAKRALYDAITGDVTLLGRPEVQQGANHCIALAEDTVIVMNRDGNMTVHGAHKTVLENTSRPAPAEASAANDPKVSNAH